MTLTFLFANPCQSQEALVQETNPPQTSAVGSGAGLYFVASPTSATNTSAAYPDTTNSTTNDQWHIAFLPYLWFAGVHGTTGVLGYNASVRASAGDLLSHLNVGLMGTLQASKKRLLLPVDFMWIRLSDSRALPLNVNGVNSIDFRAGQFILTPKAGYQIIDQPHLKVAGLVGLRYWHLGEKLTFSPALFNGVSRSQDWVDAIGGARIQMLLSPKTSIIIAGDAGGGGESPDYQVAGLLGLQVKKNIVLQAGWRHLDVHYRANNNGFLYDVALSGLLVGATFHFK